MDHTQKQSPDEYDSPWKTVLDTFFENCFLLLFPRAHVEIDWKKPVTFLDTELQQLIHDTPAGLQIVDKLVEVSLLDGKKTLVLVHVEVQAQRESAFEKRMFTYNYRIFEKYQLPVASFAILADEHPSWRPEKFGYNILGCQMGIVFPSAKIIDFKDQSHELEKNDNPFAVIILSHLKALETKKQYHNRFQGKMSLAKSLYNKGYTRDEVISLFRFIDGIMKLPKDMEQRFWQEILTNEEATKMPYVMSIEKMAKERGYQKGLEQGRKEGIRESIRKLILTTLSMRFDQLPDEIIELILKIDRTEKLEELHEKSVTASNLDEIRNALQKR